MDRLGCMFILKVGESDVTSVNIGNITMKLASLFTETMGVNGIEILEFDN